MSFGISEMMSTLQEWRGKPEELYHIIRPLALRHEERFKGKFPATSAVMGKELPRSIGALRAKRLASRATRTS
jgi:hypothetical protein